VADQVNHDDEDESERLVSDTRDSLVKLLFDVAIHNGGYEAAGPLISGWVLGLTEFIWRTRKLGTTAQQAADFWASLGRDAFETMEKQDKEKVKKQ
jgi:hypothetical protein